MDRPDAVGDADVTARRLVSDYLSRLHAAGWVLPAARREALVDRIRRLLDEQLGSPEAAARVRAVLGELGDPARLVAEDAAREPLPPAPAAPRLRHSEWGSREVAAVLLLSIGGLALPLVGPVVGLVVAWTAPGWTRVHKAVATVVAVAAPAALALPTRAGLTGQWSYLSVVVLLPLAGLVPAGYLAWVLRRSARSPGSPDRPAGSEAAASG